MNSYKFYKDLRLEQAKESAKRRRQALKDYTRALALADQLGWILKCHSESHYSLRKPQENSWLLNIYPGNGRFYYDPNKPKGPILKLKSDWTLTELLEEVVKKNDANLKLPSQENMREKAFHLWHTVCLQGS